MRRTCNKKRKYRKRSWTGRCSLWRAANRTNESCKRSPRAKRLRKPTCSLLTTVFRRSCTASKSKQVRPRLCWYTRVVDSQTQTHKYYAMNLKRCIVQSRPLSAISRLLRPAFIRSGRADIYVNVMFVSPFLLVGSISVAFDVLNAKKLLNVNEERVFEIIHWRRPDCII